MAVPPPFDTTPPEDLDHNDRGPLFEGLAWFLTALATILLALRVNCKLISRRRLWWDDWTLIACWVMLIVDNILTTILVQEYGLGRHSWDLIVSDPVKFTLILSSRATITITALVWAKTAFAVTLLRLTEGAVWRFLWFIIVSMNIAMGFSAAIPWIQCAPLAKGWDTSIDGHCWAPGVGVKIWIATGAYSALMDFTLAAIPWTFLWGLQMRKKEKIGVGIAMSMGVLAGAVAIVKCFKLNNLNSPDAYEAAELYMWDITESTAAMIAACIPSLRVLIRSVREASSYQQSFKLAHITTETTKASNKAQTQTSGHMPDAKVGSEASLWRDDSER